MALVSDGFTLDGAILGIFDRYAQFETARLASKVELAKARAADWATGTQQQDAQARAGADSVSAGGLGMPAWAVIALGGLAVYLLVRR